MEWVTQGMPELKVDQIEELNRLIFRGVGLLAKVDYRISIGWMLCN